MKFEYMVLQHQGEEEFMDMLNQYGSESWELVYVERSMFGYFLIFKRAKGD